MVKGDDMDSKGESKNSEMNCECEGSENEKVGVEKPDDVGVD